MKRYLLWIFILCYPLALSATVSSHVEPSTLTMGESFQLTLSMDNIQSSGTPDLMPLQTNFNIDATEHSVSSSIINGQSQTTNQWTIILSPKKTGTLPIPAIKIGQQSSAPSEVIVTIASHSTQHTTSSFDPIQLITETSARSAYINQQIHYTVKLYHRGQLLNANYQPPQLENTLIIPLGTSQGYQTSIHGQLYSVEEQHYALFPQKTGTQTLIGPSFQAVVYDDMPRRVQAKAESTTLIIKNKPLTYTGKHWLVAKAIYLTEHYDRRHKTLSEGSTLTRSITLEGIAVPAELLPSIAAKPNDAFGVYPEKPVLKNAIRNQDVVGTVTLQITYLLNQAGTVILPAYPITWFNTTTKQMETSTLPSRTLNVQSLKHAHQTTTVPTRSTQTQPSTNTYPTKPIINKAGSHLPWPWIAASFFACAWIMTLFFFIFRKHTSKPTLRKQSINKSLREACLSNIPTQAQAAVIHWAKHQWPHASIVHLNDVIKCVHQEDDLREQLTHLSKALYSRTKHTPWDGKKLWDLLHTYRHAPQTALKKQALASINPTQSKESKT